LSADADRVQNFLGLLNSSTGHQIAGVIMTFTFQASDDACPVGTLFECAHDMDDVNFPGAGNTNNSNVCRILQSHRTCQVRRRIPSEITAKCDNDRFKIFVHGFPLLKIPEISTFFHHRAHRVHRDFIILVFIYLGVLCDLRGKLKSAISNPQSAIRGLLPARPPPCTKSDRPHTS
jgi:hypothetical protein